MTENSVIKHYKKQLIYRQNDLPHTNNGQKDPETVKQIDNNKIYEFEDNEIKNDDNNKIEKNGKKIRRKRKNKNCRGQFRHEKMELIKLGTNPSNSMCKITTRMDKPLVSEINKNYDYIKKTITPENLASKAMQGHALPQRVPERKNSRDSNSNLVPQLPEMVPEIRNSRDCNSNKLPVHQMVPEKRHSRDCNSNKAPMMVPDGRNSNNVPLTQMVPERRNSNNVPLTQMVPERRNSNNVPLTQMVSERRNSNNVPLTQMVSERRNSNNVPLTQMVSERRNSNNVPLTQMVPERRNSNEINKASTIYRSQHTDYSVPVPIDPPYLPPPLSFPPMAFPPPPPYPRIRSPPPYYSPPHSVPRSPIRPIPRSPTCHQKSPITPNYPNVNFSFPRPSEFTTNGYIPPQLRPQPPSPSKKVLIQNPPVSNREYQENLRPQPPSPPKKILHQNPPVPNLEYQENLRSQPPSSPKKILHQNPPVPNREYQENLRSQPPSSPKKILRQNPPVPNHEYQENQTKKRKIDEHVESKPEPPIVAAIDLTIDQTVDKVPEKHHKCQCECGKTYSNEPVTEDVIITVTADRKSSQVPITSFRGKMVNGILKLDNQNDTNGINENGTKKDLKIENTSSNNKVPEGKLPQLFLIKDLLAKGVRVENKSSHNNRIPEQTHHKEQQPQQQPVIVKKVPTPVIVSPNTNKTLPSPLIRHKSQDYNNETRRQSVDTDTISISSGSSESTTKSPRPKTIDKQIPQGKLFYFKRNNSFIRYFDESQKKLFIDNLMADGKGYDNKHGCISDNTEVIELPINTVFSSKDSLTVEEYVTEMDLVEKYIPRDFFLFYKFVTGYQICNHNLPVSFLTFLKVYNTNGLKDLFDRYVNSLKPTLS